MNVIERMEASPRDYDHVMGALWFWIFVISTVLMPINVTAYVLGYIAESTLILITLILSWVAIQLSAATGIVSYIAALRAKS